MRQQSTAEWAGARVHDGHCRTWRVRSMFERMESHRAMIMLAPAGQLEARWLLF